jgi:hypothetical protein
MHRQHLAASSPSAVVSSYVFWEVHAGSSLDKRHLAASRPSTVVSTSMARSSAPFGFSAKSTMRPASSICSGSVSRFGPCWGHRAAPAPGPKMQVVWHAAYLASGPAAH